MKISTIIKRAQKFFTPRKSRSTKVTLPAPAVTREQWLNSLRVANTEATIAFLRAVEDFTAAPDIEGEDYEEYCRMVEAARMLGFPEIADSNFDNAALIAAIQYHQLCSETFSDTNLALSSIAQAVKAISTGNYLFVDYVFDDSELGEYILNEACERGAIGRSYQWLLEFVDVEELGKDFRNNNGGMFTDVGYFQYGTAFDYVS